MSSRFLSLGIVVVAFGFNMVLPAGEDFWRQKEAAQWSESEACTILLDSPWARQTTVQLHFEGLGRRRAGPEAMQGPHQNLPAGAGGPGEPNPAIPPPLRMIPLVVLGTPPPPDILQEGKQSRESGSTEGSRWMCRSMRNRLISRSRRTQ